MYNSSKQYKRAPIPQYQYRQSGGDSNDDSSDSSGDIFSPYQPFRPSLIPKSPGNEVLPPLHDTSWIGARMSPIHSHEEDKSYEEENQEYREYTEPYRKALHDSIEAGTSNIVVNERTALIRAKVNTGGSGTVRLAAGKDIIHPLWDGQRNNQRDEQREVLNSRETRKLNINWGNVVCLHSGILLGCIGVHDLYFWYVSFRLGRDDRSSFAWKLPWFCPSETTLVRFGAFVSDKILSEAAYWRILSSMFMCTSLLEYVLLLWSWTALQQHGSRPTKRWILLYILSMITGQLWMLAWDTSSVAGCACWGTCGVLCASGVAKPSRRFMFFMTTILLVILSVLQQPCSSVAGTIGSSFFGWAFYGVGLTRVTSKQDEDAVPPPVGMIRILSGIIVLLLWIIPLLRVAQY